jgi:cytoskeletal protein CcmA (bactofilin family)
MPEKIITPEGQNPSTNSSKNHLNSEVEIKGNIKFAGELTFDGRLEGDVQTDGALNLGENGHVTGNINAQSVLARGKINGNVSAKDRIELKSRSELFGDIRAAKLVIEEGVTFVGKIEVNPNKVSPTAPPPRPGEPPRAPEAPKPGGR